MLLKALALSASLLLAACAQTTHAPDAATSARDDVVQATGYDGFRFGDPRAQVSTLVNQDVEGCNSQLLGRPEGSLVFAPDERLVLLWFDAPLHTPDGVRTGDSLSEVKSAYPDAVEIPAPADSYRFDGLLVSYGEHGYLFLHDGKTVRKAIAGYVDYLKQLFDTGFGVC